MSRVKSAALASLLFIALAARASASPVLAEHVTGGQLDLPWVGGFDTPNAMYGKTLDASDPAYANPSGDHTVAVAQSSAAPDSGGIIVTTVDPGPVSADYTWEGWMFTGSGSTRRGLIVRATPGNNFKSFYMLVVEQGLFRLRFRKIVDSVPTTLQEWFATVLPAGMIPQDSWHKMKVVADGNQFRCFFDDFELTTTPIVDSDVASGWVGCYNFRFDLGNVPVYFDDLVLSCARTVPVALDLTPNTLNLRSMGQWVTGFIEPEPPLGTDDIDVASIRLNGVVGVDPDTPTSAGDHDGDGRPDLAVKFRRSDVELAVSEGESVPVTVSGAIGGVCFEGTDEIRVIRPAVYAPRAGDQLAAGAVAEVRWELPAGVAAPTVAVLSSIDDGASWTLVANGLPNTGAWDWTVPDSPAQSARVAVVQIESADESGYEVEGVLATSQRFGIVGPLAVPGAPGGFELRPIANPSTGPLRVSFALPSAGPATLEAYDVGGRLIGSREVGGFGPGRRALTLVDRAPIGVYVVRLSQAGKSAATRVTVVR